METTTWFFIVTNYMHQITADWYQQLIPATPPKFNIEPENDCF